MAKIMTYFEDATGLDIDGACHKAKRNRPKPLITADTSPILSLPQVYYEGSVSELPQCLPLLLSQHDQTTSGALSKVTARWAAW
jgi:hypothetical protein